MPATQEWRVGEADPDSEEPPAELPTELSASNPGPPGDEPPEKADDPPPADAGSAGPPAGPSARRGDTAERIRVAAADAADAAEHRSVDEILALEEDLERAKVEAATKLEELEGRLTGMEDRAASAEREAHDARAKAADLERELDQVRAGATGAAATGAVDQAELERRVTAERERLEHEFESRTAAAERAPAPLPGDANAAQAVQEALGEVQEAEARATAAKQAQVEAERRLRAEADRRVAAEAEQRAAERTEATLVPGAAVSLSSATFDDLRGLGLSVTQVKRILDFRDRLGGFDSVDDLDYVPGFPRSLLGELKRRVSL